MKKTIEFSISRRDMSRSSYRDLTADELVHEQLYQRGVKPDDKILKVTEFPDDLNRCHRFQVTIYRKPRRGPMVPSLNRRRKWVRA